MKTNWSKMFLELVQYRSREEDAGQEEAQGEASMCLVKDVEINHPKMSELELNHHKMSDQLLHELLKNGKAVEIRTVILVVMKKIITDGLQK